MGATMFRSRLAVWLGLTVLTAWSWGTASPALAPDWARAGVSPREGQVYYTAGPRPLTLDVYLPAGAAIPVPPDRRHAVVLVIHGGSWCGGSKTAYRNDDPRNTIVRLVQHGFVVVAVDYTLARPGAPSWPRVIDELREAVRWVRRRAAEYHADPDRIAVIGQSSGAHLAALLGALPDEKGPDGVSSRVQAVVSFYGPSDLAHLAAGRGLPHEPIHTFLGGSGAEAASPIANASPVYHVSHDAPPMLLLHGTDDAWVPLEQSELLAESLARAGVPHRLIVVEGARHGFEAWAGAQRDYLPEIFAFLESVWNVSIGEPTAGKRDG
jgi:acetyl esterase/lipase